jgi:hypothetical protein
MRKHIEPYSGYLLVALILLSGCEADAEANDAGVIGASIVLGMCAGIVGMKLDGSEVSVAWKGAALLAFGSAALLILGGA